VYEITKNWLYSGQAEKITNVLLNLDMGKKSLEICLQEQVWLLRRSLVFDGKRFM
jgi:hypothetical protein